MAAKKVTVKARIPEEMNKALVLFVAGILAVVVSRMLNGLTGDLLALFGLVFFAGAFYFVLKWSGLWDKIK